MIKPTPFAKGKKIGIVALAGPMKREDLLAGEKTLKNLGFDVLMAPSCFERDGYLAGTSDMDRAMDLMMLFADDEVGAVLNMRGGYGSNRTVPYLKGFNFARYPKPFIGYSDITYMHLYLNQVHGLITYHGPMLKDLTTGDALTTSSFMDVGLQGESITMKQVPYYDRNLPTTTGTTVGGNLSIVCSTLGTPMEINTKGKVLFLEEVNEEPYQIDRLLMQLLYAGKLDVCSGIILGDFKGSDQVGIFDTIKKVLTPLEKPVAYGVPAGHTIPNVVIPLGARCVLIPAEGRIEIGYQF